jgi:hypothetical protein
LRVFMSVLRTCADAGAYQPNRAHGNFNARPTLTAGMA